MENVANDKVRQQAFAPRRPATDPRRCVILVPFSTHIVPACERGLIELQRRGYEVWRVGGYAAIDVGRAELATKALALTPSTARPHPGPFPEGEGVRGSGSLPVGEGFGETFWIDSDIDFSPDAVDRIRSHGLPITSGIVARKGARAIASQTLPGTGQLRVGAGGGLVEILYAGAGFLHVRREVYTAIREKLALPLCNAQFGRPMVPFFQPMIVPWRKQPSPCPLPVGEGSERAGVPALAGGHGEKPAKAGTPTEEPPKAGTPANEATHWYLGEDYSFCERAR